MSDLNDIDAQLARGDIGAALAAQTNRIEAIVLSEQVNRTLEFKRIEQVFVRHNGFLLEAIDNRLKVMNEKIDHMGVTFHRRIDDIEAIVKELRQVGSERSRQNTKDIDAIKASLQRLEAHDAALRRLEAREMARVSPEESQRLIDLLHRVAKHVGINDEDGGNG